MNENVYAAPNADLVSSEESQEAAAFYVVSNRKFVWLLLGTMGFYQVYWFYKHWRQYADATDQKMWPVLRAIFAVFFIHALFRRIADKLSESGIELKWNHTRQATALVLLLVLSSVLNQLSNHGFGAPYTGVLAVAMIIPIMTFLGNAQKAANIACGDPQGESNNTFTLANYLWIALGMLLWVLFAVGVYVLLLKAH